MAITRRRFLTASGALAAGAIARPSLFGNAFVRQALAETIGDRYLVVLFLEGGNDGLNTITPIDDGGATLRAAYNTHRLTGGGGLNLPPGSLLPLGADPGSGAQIGMHPGLAGLWDLYNLGKVAVIQGCGYPDYSLSHDESQVIWETANPLRLSTFAGTGWVGRHLAANYGPTAIPGVTIDEAVASELRNLGTSVLAIRRLRRFGFPYDDFDAGEQPKQRDAFEALYLAAAASGNPSLELLGNSGGATLISSEAYPSLHDLYETQRPEWVEAYDAVGRSTSSDLREIAKIIYGVEQAVPNVDARFFQLQNGGYDTHSDQGGAEADGAHTDLHQEIGNSLKVFYEDLEDMGVADKVAVVVWSEFSRRIPQNQNGTDHGSQGPMFLIGGKVNGGLVGNHPNINDAALDDEGNTVYSQAAGDDFRSTDFRDVYGSILKQWANMPHGDVLGIMPLDTASPADEYWTVEDFDLPLFDP
jgi:uncharacterized protein (DUF1501 family)